MLEGQVTIVNRTNQDLVGTWDGRRYELEAGKEYGFPLEVAKAFRKQNPVMGTLDPYSGVFDSKLAIVEEGDPTDKIEINDEAIELINRSVVGGPDTKVITQSAGLFGRRQNDASLGTVDGMFRG